MLTTTHQSYIPRLLVIAALTKLRQEWQEAADGKSLVDVNASVGLLLADISKSVGLTSLEQNQIFGVELIDELRDVLSSQTGDNGRQK